MREGTGKGGLRFLVEAKLVETSDRKRDFEIWARGGEARVDFAKPQIMALFCYANQN